MAPTSSRFIVHGCCPGLESPYNPVAGTISGAYDEGLQASFTTESIVWRFNLPQQGVCNWRPAGFLFSSSHLTCNLPHRARSRSQSVWSAGSSAQPPADRPPREPVQFLSVAVREQSGDIDLRALSTPSSHAKTEPAVHGRPAPAPPPASTGRANSLVNDSALHRHALPQLLIPPGGPRNSDSTDSHPTIRTHVVEGIIQAIHIAQQLQHPSELSVAPSVSPHRTYPLALKRSTARHCAANSPFDPHTLGASSAVMATAAGVAAAVATERPHEVPLLAQLRGVCLASVASALVHLPKASRGEPTPSQGPLPGSVFPRLGNPNLQLGGGGSHGDQIDSTGPEPATPAVNSLPSRTTGHQPPAVLSAAALALAAGAGPPTGAAPAAETCVRLLHTVGITDLSCDGSSNGCSSSNSNLGAAPQRRWVFLAIGRGSKRNPSSPLGQLEVPPEQQAAQKVASTDVVVGATARAAQEAERQQEVERPKAFSNPLRYCKLLFAGAMSAVVSRTCVAPLERVKMDLLLKNGTGDAFTTAAQVLRTEGIGGFWKGNALNVLRTAPFKAVNFFSFDMYHTAFMVLSGRDENFERFMAGACAGVTATLVCFPLDVVRTRLMASVVGPRYGSGPFSTLAGILRNEGAAALYSGCLPAVIGMAPAGAVFYGVYDLLKHRHLERLAAEIGSNDDGAAAAAVADTTTVMATKEASKATTQQQLQPQPQPLTLDPLYTLMYGAMAGAASELIVYPLEVIRRKMQLQSMALANMRQMGGLHPHSHNLHHHHGPLLGDGGAAIPGAASAAGGRLAAAAHHHHHHMLPYHLGAQKMIATLSAAAVANSPGLARVAAAVTAILSTDGPRGFYSGLLPNMLQVLPSAALSYYTYDTLKTMLGAR